MGVRTRTVIDRIPCKEFALIACKRLGCGELKVFPSGRLSTDALGGAALTG
ncbi:hypothetical protein [Mesorhizobium sp.]|uniref:hypothetical protein n=1 Tax=Mesorhizobium sp. TaxID=1871066 RepID=UPI0025C323B9|nr:hypothetical protein [Mesorhizobium sp.]